MNACNYSTTNTTRSTQGMHKIRNMHRRNFNFVAVRFITVWKRQGPLFPTYLKSFRLDFRLGCCQNEWLASWDRQIPVKVSS
jgi:hypothetical protein